MKNCTRCVHATWKKTVNGRLHPNGNGRCTKEVKLPSLPQSKFVHRPVVILGGHINRKIELKDHCVYYSEVKS